MVLDDDPGSTNGLRVRILLAELGMEEPAVYGVARSGEAARDARAAPTEAMDAWEGLLAAALRLTSPLVLGSAGIRRIQAELPGPGPAGSGWRRSGLRPAGWAGSGRGAIGGIGRCTAPPSTVIGSPWWRTSIGAPS